MLAPLLLWFVDDDWLRLLLMAAGSTIAVVLASLYGPRTEPTRLVAFYRAVRPPGWWRRTAASAGMSADAPLADLRRRMGSVLACAVSTYAWLMGGAGLLLGGGPLWHALSIIALGFAAMPFWWHAFREEPAAVEAVGSSDRPS